MKPRQKRDKRGRFIKSKPKAPPLDPALVAQLGQGRPAVVWAAEQYWVFQRWEPEPDTTEEPCERI
jgi:hypothetical protein